MTSTLIFVSSSLGTDPDLSILTLKMNASAVCLWTSIFGPSFAGLWTVTLIVTSSAIWSASLDLDLDGPCRGLVTLTFSCSRSCSWGPWLSSNLLRSTFLPF